MSMASGIISITDLSRFSCCTGSPSIMYCPPVDNSPVAEMQAELSRLLAKDIERKMLAPLPVTKPTDGPPIFVNPFGEPTPENK